MSSLVQVMLAPEERDVKRREQMLGVWRSDYQKLSVYNSLHWHIQHLWPLLIGQLAHWTFVFPFEATVACTSNVTFACPFLISNTSYCYIQCCFQDMSRSL